MGISPEGREQWGENPTGGCQRQLTEGYKKKKEEWYKEGERSSDRLYLEENMLESSAVESKEEAGERNLIILRRVNRYF